jgi:ankyrin repeat protein
MTQLPGRPSLRHLRNQAKALLREIHAGHGDAIARLREHHPRGINPASASLSDAQLVIARTYGFTSWPRLKQYVERLEGVERRVADLRQTFARGDAGTRQGLLARAHTLARMQDHAPGATTLSDADARLLVANQEGYAFWQKYDSYLHLEPAVQQVIDAVRVGDRGALQEILAEHPSATNPRWVAGYAVPRPVPNDSIPLFCVSEASFRKTNQRGNEYELVADLAAAGADVETEGGLPLTSAVSFGVLRAVEALLDRGASVDGVDGDGAPMAYALHFGFAAIAELLARRGAVMDLRFAAGLGRLDVVRDWFNSDGSLKPGAGALVDPYALERKVHGESPFRCERTRQNVLDQSLYFAVRNGRLDVAELLLSRGADINAIVPGLDSRATILHLVAANGVGDRLLDDVVCWLVERDADLARRDADYQGTPLGWALHLKRPRAVQILRRFGATE